MMRRRCYRCETHDTPLNSPGVDSEPRTGSWPVAFDSKGVCTALAPNVAARPFRQLSVSPAGLFSARPQGLQGLSEQPGCTPPQPKRGRGRPRGVKNGMGTGDKAVYKRAAAAGETLQRRGRGRPPGVRNGMGTGAAAVAARVVAAEVNTTRLSGHWQPLGKRERERERERDRRLSPTEGINEHGGGSGQLYESGAPVCEGVGVGDIPEWSWCVCC
jgi:hypothetical protein